MGDNIWLPDRNGVRTPMQWRSQQTDATAGFSANPYATPYSPLIADDTYNPDIVNVDGTLLFEGWKMNLVLTLLALDAMNDAASIFHVIKFMVRTRKSHPCFSRGTLTHETFIYCLV